MDRPMLIWTNKTVWWGFWKEATPSASGWEQGNISPLLLLAVLLLPWEKAICPWSRIWGEQAGGIERACLPAACDSEGTVTVTEALHKDGQRRGGERVWPLCVEFSTRDPVHLLVLSIQHLKTLYSKPFLLFFKTVVLSSEVCLLLLLSFINLNVIGELDWLLITFLNGSLIWMF